MKLRSCRATLCRLAPLLVLACEARPAIAPSGPSHAVVSLRGPAGSPRSIDVALTVDDLPDHGPVLPGQSRADIHRAFVTAFRAHRLPPVYGFVNGGSLEGHPEDRAALHEWVLAGNLLGNHTRTHPDLYKTTLDAYLADVDANEPLLREMAGGADARTWRVFRYPFLQEGTDNASRARLRQQIVARGYRVAEVTIDFYDWAYNEPYARCAASHDLRGISALKTSYLSYAGAALQWADAAARELVGRPIEQILLLHIGAFDAELLDELLSLYERHGAHFVSLETALADPVYATEPARPTAWEGTFLAQIREARGVSDPPDMPLPEALLDALCR